MDSVSLFSSSTNGTINGLSRTVIIFDNVLDNDNVCALTPSANLFTGAVPLSIEDGGIYRRFPSRTLKLPGRTG
jgi:hypothetical protein